MGNSSIKGPCSILNHLKSPFCCGEKLLLNSPQLYLRSFWGDLRLLLGLSRNVQKCVCYVCYVVHIYIYIFTYPMFVYDCICIILQQCAYMKYNIYIILYNILQLYDMEPEGLAMAHEACPGTLTLRLPPFPNGQHWFMNPMKTMYICISTISPSKAGSNPT